jgi:NTP pyrophosphatase (non-canonical NTP hydrolase)
MAKMSKKTGVPKAPKDKGGDLGLVLYGLAKEVGEVAHQLRDLYHLDSMSDHVGELASAFSSLADATAMSVIANSGTQEDRETAVKYLKQRFEEFRK